MTERSRKPAGQHVLAVESTEWLGPHLVRVFLTGESLGSFPDNGCTDSYVKLIFVDPSLDIEPPYDLAALRETLPAEAPPGAAHLHGAPGRPGRASPRDRLRHPRRLRLRGTLGRHGEAR